MSIGLLFGGIFIGLIVGMVIMIAVNYFTNSIDVDFCTEHCQCGTCGCGDATVPSCTLVDATYATGVTPVTTVTPASCALDSAMTGCTLSSATYDAATPSNATAEASCTYVKGSCTPTGGAIAIKPVESYYRGY